MSAFRCLLLVAHGLLLGAEPLRGQFAVADLQQVAAGPEIRQRPVVAVGATGLRVFWAETREVGQEGSVGQRRIWGRQIDLHGQPEGEAELAAGDWDDQGSPAAAVAADVTWLAHDFMHQDMRPGDSDLALVPFVEFFGFRGTPVRLTRESPRGPTITRTAPALLYDSLFNRLILAHGTGVFRDGTGWRGGDYDSVNIEIRELDRGGTVRHQFVVKGPDETGEAAMPSLTFLPEGWRERYLLAYVANGTRRELGTAGSSVYLELFGDDWRVLGGRHMALPIGGASWPSVAAVGGKLYLAWVENATSDIFISELDQELWPMRPMRLSTALDASEFTERLGPVRPRLDAPVLFDHFGQLGIAFVLTREWLPERGRAWQEIWVGRMARTR
ncbi:MAG TPA: hypothetical protein VMK53_02310 [Gemmatimonadales bacterium]|nr:hypothetical protein [Gemmatimonadales bacterium]